MNNLVLTTLPDPLIVNICICIDEEEKEEYNQLNKEKKTTEHTTEFSRL